MKKFSLRKDDRIGERTLSRVKEARRTVGCERHYHCSCCGFDRSSRIDLRECPSCGSGFARATVVKSLLA